MREVEGDLARGSRGRSASVARMRERNDLDAFAAENLVAYLEEEQEVSGALPTDRRIVVERFRDELGDWRIVVLTPFGGRVHAPWSVALEARLAERLGAAVRTIWSDDGIAIRLPEGELEMDPAPWRRCCSRSPTRWRISSSAASRTRPCSRRGSARTRRAPCCCPAAGRARGRRSGSSASGQPTSWPSRAATAASRSSSRRIASAWPTCSTWPPCARSSAAWQRREIAVHSVETVHASPFASSLLFDYVAAYMYDGDAPLAERRAQALTLDRDLLRELLGQEELRELLDPAALADLELALQGLAEDRRVTTQDGVHDLLRRVGDLRMDEVVARLAVGCGRRGSRGDRDAWLAGLVASHRAVAVRIAGEERWIAIEDAARYRDALGVSPPRGVPEAFLAPAAGALEGLLARWGRTHGPFLTEEPAARWGLPARLVEDALERLLAAGTLLRGEFRPGGAEREWCDPDVLRSLRRRSLARLRHEVEPVEPAALARFLPDWHGVAPVGRARPAAAPWPGGPGAARRGRGPADRRCHPGVGPGARRPAGAGARLSAAPARRARRARRGRLGGPGQPEPRRRTDRPVPARPGGAARRRRGRGRRGGTAGGSASRGDPGPPRPPRGVLLPRALRRRRRRAGPRRPRRAVGPRVGRRGHERHVRPAAGAALASPGRATARPRPGRLTALGPPEAAGRWSLVEEGRRRRVGAAGPAPHGADARPRARAAGAPRVLTREAVAAEAVAGGFSAVYPVLRAMEEAGRIRRGYFVDGLGAAQFAQAGALDRLRAVREPAGANGSAEPRIHLLAAADPANPYGAALAWPRRGDDDRRPLPRAAGAYVVLVDGQLAIYLERGGSGLQTFPAADDPVVGARALRALGTLVADGRVRELVIAQGRRPPDRRFAMARAAARGRVRARLPRARPPLAGRTRADALNLPPTCPKATRSSGRRPASARTSSGAPSGRRARDRRRPGRTPRRAPRSIGRHDRQEPALRVLNGLELRTHLRMNGTWHRYRPGERWRRPAARAVLVLEVEGAVAVCFDAPVVELFEARAEGLHPALAPLGPDLLGRNSTRPRHSGACASPSRAESTIGEALLDQRVMAGVGNVYRSEILFIGKVDPFASRRLARRRDPGTARGHGTPAPARERRPEPGPERSTTEGAREAGGAPLWVYGRAGRPCRRCGTRIRSASLGRELPRTVWWCPSCQRTEAAPRSRIIGRRV